MNNETLKQQNITEIDRICSLSPVIPVLTFNSLDEVLPIAEALVKGGLPVLEVTLRTDIALEAIKLIADNLPDAQVGAGTVLNPEQYQAACEAGATFIVTPGSTTELLKHALTQQVPLLPGIQTISELMQAYALGYKRFKFFPAEVSGGVNALKAFAGPIGDVRFCPTGGIRLESAADYLNLNNVMCVGGSWLTPQALIDQQDWAAIQQIARDTVFQLRPHQNI